MNNNDSEFLGELIGVDVGGTFTDLVRLNQSTGKVRLAKVASTMENQAFGVMQALDEAGTNLRDVALVVHGTTTTTNAVLERKLSRTGLITTSGFRDILELGRLCWTSASDALLLERGAEPGLLRLGPASGSERLRAPRLPRPQAGPAGALPRGGREWTRRASPTCGWSSTLSTSTCAS